MNLWGPVLDMQLNQLKGKNANFSMGYWFANSLDVYFLDKPFYPQLFLSTQA